MPAILLHILKHPIRSVTTIAWVTFSFISWGGVALGLVILACAIVILSILYMWHKIGDLAEETGGLTSSVGTLSERIASLEKTLKDE